MSESPELSNSNKYDSTPPVAESPHSEDAQQTKVEEIKQRKQHEVSYESLVVSLKEKNKEFKKIENLQKKLEDRFKEKVKQAKELLKEKQVVDNFLSHLF